MEPCSRTQWPCLGLQTWVKDLCPLCCALYLWLIHKHSFLLYEGILCTCTRGFSWRLEAAAREERAHVLLSVHMLLCMPQAGMREVRTTVGAGLKLQLSRLKGCTLTHAAERAAAD